MNESKPTPFKKVMVANRGEIAIRIFRACTELGISTVAIYSEEDRLHLHRYKADEAYLVGKGKTPIAAYLEFDEIIQLAVEKGVDAIHPGYGFLSENADFARACQAAGIVFIGPPPEVLDALGDKIAARHIAIKADVPVIPGTEDAIATEQEALLFAKEYGYPLIVKAAMGGGGRGMSIVRDRSQLLDAITRSREEARNSFGSARVFIERYLEKPRHIEVQIIADQHDNMVHLFERDCSIQRRHQKVVELAPARHLSPQLKQKLYDDAITICKQVGYVNAGTVEFLVDGEGKHYFIEVNPRIQVEHTITEIITGRDIVQIQIRVAEGYPLQHELIRIESQKHVKKSGHAIQLRITTEDPANQFAPDTGKLTAFRAGEGFGIRLDAGSGFEGAIITPHYDSLLIKLCAWSLHHDLAATKALRALREFRIRGVKTNIPFLENVLNHKKFLEGTCDTTFIENTPALFQFKPRLNRANKLLRYLGQVAVNGFPNIAENQKPTITIEPQIPEIPKNAKHEGVVFRIFKERQAEGLARWIYDQKQVFITDTTMRDAHQSLLATRMRSYDMCAIAAQTEHLMPHLFSSEMWGGATFDVAMRFLHESPWERLRQLRKLMPNTLLQMLIRSGNAVGYTNYPDNVVKAFIEHSAKEGIDVFRIFDCLNWVESLKPCIDAVAATGKIAEVAVCYSGDISDNKRVKFTLPYYIQRAKEIEAAGAHILAVKDMAGLLKPAAARILITELKQHLTIPIHLHTHDTSGNGIATLMEATNAGVDIVDAALSSMSGMTSQPSLNALVTALENHERDPGFSNQKIQPLADYWEAVRESYTPFESGLKAGTADVYRHEIPGGQYSNLRPQAIALGLGHRWEEIKHTYRTVNDMLGEIIKVTPSSKAVGDMAMFMVQNNLTPDDVIARGSDLAFPDSFVSLVKGMMGQPDGGFPEDLQRVVLKGAEPITCRPGDLLEAYDFDNGKRELKTMFNRDFDDMEELITYALYPKVYVDYVRFHDRFGDLSVIDTPTFFYGLKKDEEKAITIQEGKTLIIKLLAIGEIQTNGNRELFFELNGRGRNLEIFDESAGITVARNEEADPTNSDHVGAPMSGKITDLFVREGDKVEEGQKLMTTEAMKMLNVIVAPKSGKITSLPLAKGKQVSPGDLVAVIG